MTSRVWRIALSLAVVMMALGGAVTSAAAQIGTGSVSGTVHDAVGAIVPGATVSLVSATKSTSEDAVTNDRGNFTFPTVPVDTYSVRVTLSGFKTLERPGVIVHAGDRVALGVLRIEVGTLEETVLVSGAAPMIQASSGERSFAISSEVVANTAINTRNINSLTFLAPGMVAGSVNGTRTNQNNFQIDGIGAMDTGNNGVMIQVNPEVIEEVKVLTSNYQAEYGRSAGAQISAVTKSGSQQFRGSAYAVRRNDDLNANNWFNNREGTPKPKLDQKDYGFTVGGPVGKPNGRARLFFFVAQEYQPRTTSGALVRLRLPTALERQGDFSQSRDNNGNLFNLIRDASTGLPCTAADTRGCFRADGVLGRIPQDRLYNVGMNILRMYPVPNALGGETQSNSYNYENLQGTTENPRRQDTFRFDWQVASTLRVHGKVLQTGGHTFTPGQIPGILDTYNNTPGNRTMSFSVDATLNAVTVMEATYGQSRNQLRSLPANGDLANRTALGLASFPYLYPDAMIIPSNSYAYSVLKDETGWIDNGRINVPPQFTWGNRIANPPPSYNVGQQNPNFGARSPWLNLNRTQDLVLNVTRLMGSHTAKAGVYFTHNRKAQAANNSPGVLMSFGNDANNPLDTGFGFANAALGIYQNYTQAAHWIEGNYIYNNIEWFLQDNWKASGKLTLDYGVRFYWIPPQYDSFLLASNFLPDKYSAANAPRLYYPGIVNGARVGIDRVTGNTVPVAYIGRVVPNTGQLMNGLFEAGKGIDEKLYRGNGILTAPRFGFAYDLTGSQRFVIRGGSGAFYNRERGDTIYQMVTNPPNAIQPTLLFGRLQDINSSSAVIAPPSLQVVDFNAKIPTTIPYTIGLQMALPWSSSLDVSYVGSYSYNQTTQRNINAPNYGAAYLPQNQDPTAGQGCAGCAALSTVPGANALPVDFYRPYPGFGNISFVEWAAYSRYNSLQTSFNRRFRNGLSVLVNYTLGKAMGTSSADLPIMTNVNAIGAQRNDENNRKANYAPLNIDRRHTLVSNFVWQLPNTHLGVLADSVLHDWQLSGVFRAGSGPRYTVTYSIPGINARNLTGAEGMESARIVIVGDPGSGQSDDPYRQFNAAAFTIPSPGSIGLESGLNYMVGSPDHTLDLSISRRFRIGRQRRFEVRVDAFNALNTVIFSGRNATLNVRSLTDPTPTNLPYDASGNLIFANRTGFGAATSADPPRTVQLLARFQF